MKKLDLSLGHLAKEDLHLLESPWLSARVRTQAREHKSCVQVKGARRFRLPPPGSVIAAAVAV